MQALMSYDYMSSEESEEEVEEGGAVRALFVVKVLPWERRELREAKRELDEEHCKGLSKRALYKRFKRKRDGCSNRLRPVNAPRWAVRAKNKAFSSSTTTPPASV